MTFTASRMLDRGRVRWRVRGLVDGERKSFGLYDSREEAERRAAALNRKAAGSPRAMSLLAYGEAWLDRRERSGMFRSVRSMRSLWRAHVAPSPLASMAMRQIQPIHVSRWIDGLRGARQTQLNALNLLRRCLADARREGRIGSNPASGMEIPKRVERDKWDTLSPREIESVISCGSIPARYRDAYAVAIFTGLRAGELWGLTWERVHLSADPPFLEVVASYSEAPKTERGKRIVPLLPPAVDALRRIRGGQGRIGLVWPARDGKPHRNGYDAQWATMRAKAGIVRRVRFHDLRHTCAASLVSGAWGRAWRLEEVRDWLGHSSVTVTERYARFRPDTIRSAGRDARDQWSRPPAGQTRDKPEPETISSLKRKRAK